MNRYKESPSRDKALAALRALVTRLSSAGTAFLPPIRELSRSIGVCHLTVVKALRVLEAQGVVQVSPRRGIRIIGPVAAVAGKTPAEEPRLPPRWQQVADTIAEGILSGAHPRGELLPSCKELSRTCAACHAVVKRALASLVRRGLIARSGRGFRVLQTRAAGARATIIFAASSADIAVLSTQTLQSAELWRSIERECDRRNVRLELRSLRDCLKTLGRPSARPGSLLGCVVWTVAPEPQTVADVARTAVLAGLPVAVLDESGAGDTVWAGSWASGLALFPVTTSIAPGHRMGTHLTRLGHRRLAYVAPESDGVAGRRLAGLEQALTDAGLPAETPVFSPSRQLTSQESIESSAPFRRWQETLRGQAGTFCAAVGAERDDDTPLRFAWEYGRRRLTAVELEPVFDALAAASGPTAWVCYNDAIAVAALSYCRRHRIAVPQDVSIAGFDDTMEAFGLGLTSYSFNVPGVVSAVFEYLLSPRRPGQLSGRPRVIEVPGMVMERASTGVPA